MNDSNGRKYTALALSLFLCQEPVLTKFSVKTLKHTHRETHIFSALMTFLRQYRWGICDCSAYSFAFVLMCLHVSMHMFRQYDTGMYARECRLRHGLYVRMCNLLSGYIHLSVYFGWQR